MKKCFWALAAFVLGTALSASAVEDNIGYGMTNKLTRGVVNVCTGWVEIPVQVYEGYADGLQGFESINNSKCPSASRSLGAGVGFFRGIWHAIGRTAWGATDAVTFWAKDPIENVNMNFLLDGKWAWTPIEKRNCKLACDVKKQCCKGEIKSEANEIEKMGYRMARGMDSIGGALFEIPCQTDVYWENHHNAMCIVGFFDGTWLAVSKLVNGAFEFALCPFPSPRRWAAVPYNAEHKFSVCTQYNTANDRLTK